MGASCPTASARSASPVRKASIASITASVPPMLWLVMHAFAPLNPWRMPIWPRTLFGSVRNSHIGLTLLESSWPKAGNFSYATVSNGK